jgi:pilus assembly protein CpaF
LSTVEEVWVRELTGRVAAELANREDEFRRPGGEVLREALAAQLLRDGLDDLERSRLTQGLVALGPHMEEELGARVRARLFGLGELERLLQDESIENLFINGPDKVLVQRAGEPPRRIDWSFESNEALNEAVSDLAANQGRSEHRFDSGHPEVSIRLQDGSRLTAVRELSGDTVVAVRRHRHTDVDVSMLYGLGTLSELLHGLLPAIVRARLNVLIVGGTDAGKTTLLRAMIHEIPTWERLVTIEDALELHLAMHPERHENVIELECREANVEGQGEYTMRQLTKIALRLSPQRVIVGEVRGPEILDMFQAMSQGNDGSIGTLHARSSKDAFVQVMRYALRAPEQLTTEAIAVDIASALNLVIHVHKLRDGRRAISSIREVTGFTGAQVTSDEVFAPDAYGRAVPSGTPFQDDTTDLLIDAGFNPVLWQIPGGGWRQ